MSGASQTETLGFQAEVKQLLHLMIHSLYSNREIFLRELISNASDAADKLRFEAISSPALLEDDPELSITVRFDSGGHVIEVTDNGIGMTREDVIQQLGTIARSGTAEFLARLGEDQQRDSRLIGQFGVGFYSSFIVARRVDVETRRAGTDPDEGVRWTSDGEGEFTVEPLRREARGTTVRLHLRDDAGEFADADRLRHLITRYSDHIAFPVFLRDATSSADAQADEPGPVNTAKALWVRPRSEISDDEYREFYKHLAHDFSDPLAWSHNRVEGKREFTSLLYIPSRAPFDLWNREAPRGVKLYVQRVFIMDHAEQFLPLYLRFVRGVVDSSDLSLNVSREMLQQDANVDAIRTALTRRALEMLGRMADDEPEKYAGFWQQFGRVLKEGPAEDPENRARIAGLLRFATTKGEGEQDQSLADYVSRRQQDQKAIWYLTADSPAAARSSPHLEAFRSRGIEVLLLSDPIDEWLMGHLGDYEELPLRDVRRGDLDLGPAPEAPADTETADAGLLERVRTELGERVAEVRASDRLTSSASCLALGEYEMGQQMRRLLEASGQAVPEAPPVLELNLAHPLVRRLAAETDAGRFGELAELLLDEARLADGRALEDPARFVERVNRLLVGDPA